MFDPSTYIGLFDDLNHNESVIPITSRIIKSNANRVAIWVANVGTSPVCMAPYSSVAGMNYVTQLQPGQEAKWYWSRDGFMVTKDWYAMIPVIASSTLTIYEVIFTPNRS